MSTDLRALLRDLAEHAPAIENRLALADTSFSAGRRRRLVRRLEFSSASAVVLVVALLGSLFVGSAPLAAEYGTSGGNSVHGYPKQIGAQWPVLDLPAKPGPLAALIETDSGWDAVSATGHRWHLPRAIQLSMPQLSPDGRILGYMPAGVNGVGDGYGRYTVLDLVSGKRTVFPDLADAFGCECHNETTARHQLLVGGGGAATSTDDRYVLLDQYILDIAGGTVLTVLPAQGVGWSGDRVLARPIDTSVKQVDYYDLHGTLVASTPLVTLPGLAVVSPDGRSLAALSSRSDGLYRIDRLDLGTGRATSLPLTVQAVNEPALAYRDQVALLTTSRSDGSTYDQVTGVYADGSAHTLIRLTGPAAFRPVNGHGLVLAADVLSGPARGPLLLDRATEFVIGHDTAIAWYAGLVALLLLVRWRVGARRRRRVRDNPDTVSKRWDRRWLLTLLIPVVALAVLTPELLAPMATGDLSSSVAPVWWAPDSPVQSRFPQTDLYPVSLVVGRHGQRQGFAVRVTNTTSRAQTVLGLSGNKLAFGGKLTMSTRDGSREQAVSLTYGRIGTIPAHQSRWVNDLGVTTICAGENGSFFEGALPLRIRIGWVTRTEQIGLFPHMGLTGPDPACGGQ